MKTRDFTLLGVLLCCAAFVALLLLLGRFPGCSFHLNVGHRSGPVNDDYVEEPLGDSVKKYEHALFVSNEVIDKLKAGDYRSIRQALFDDSIKATLDEDWLVGMDKDIAKHFGAMKGYKPMQWSFATSFERGKDLLYSSKIVEYERGMVRFTFVFLDDGQYRKLVGFHTRERTGVAQPGQF